MNTESVITLTDVFEVNAQKTDGGVEYWLARDLQHLLGYGERRHFTSVIVRAKTSCEVCGHSIPDHFVDVNKMVALGSGSRRERDAVVASAQWVVASGKTQATNPPSVFTGSFALRSQSATSTSHPGKGGRRYPPWVFTEYGVVMSPTVLDIYRAVANSFSNLIEKVARS